MVSRKQVLEHPSFPDVRRSVPASEVKRWLAQGWRRVVQDAPVLERDGDVQVS